MSASLGLCRDFRPSVHVGCLKLSYARDQSSSDLMWEMRDHAFSPADACSKQRRVSCARKLGSTDNLSRVVRLRGFVSGRLARRFGAATLSSVRLLRRYRGYLAGTTLWAVLVMVAAGTCTTVRAQDTGRLLATSGVSQIEGAGGGGLVPWALITGYGTRDAVGANAHYTLGYLPDFTLHSTGASVGVLDRVELSYAHQWFDTRRVGAKLGLGAGYQFQLDIVGAKVRLFGNAVYDQDSWMPQVAAGVQLKTNNQHATLRAIGAQSASGADFYVAATKLFLAESLLLNVTVRTTKANQFGLLGFGGDRHGGYSAHFEGSAALLLTRNLAVGAEIRSKPDNLGFAKEETAYVAFAAYFINKNVSATLGVVALGSVARQPGQTGLYLSLQGGF